MTGSMNKGNQPYQRSFCTNNISTLDINCPQSLYRNNYNGFFHNIITKRGSFDQRHIKLQLTQTLMKRNDFI